MEGVERHADRVERFRVLYDAAYPKVMAYVMRRARSQDDVHDVVSEVFVTVWRRLDGIPDDPARMPWVYGVARRALANHYRSRTRKAALQARLEAEPATRPGDFDVVHEALDALRPDDRELLRLAAWEDLDNDQIAVVVGVTPGVAAVRLHRARKRLARALAERGIGGDSAETVKSDDASRTPGGVYGTQSGEVKRE